MFLTTSHSFEEILWPEEENIHSFIHSFLWGNNHTFRILITRHSFIFQSDTQFIMFQKKITSFTGFVSFFKFYHLVTVNSTSSSTDFSFFYYN